MPFNTRSFHARAIHPRALSVAAAHVTPRQRPAASESTDQVKALAQFHGVAIDNVSATGAGGRVTADDVRRAAEDRFYDGIYGSGSRETTVLAGLELGSYPSANLTDADEERYAAIFGGDR